MSEVCVELVGKLVEEMLGLSKEELLIAPFLLHRSTLHCYSVPWQTAT